MSEYNPKEIEQKWQAYWDKNKLFKTPADATPENKMYILPQLPYPSGSGLHVGHAEVYTACDIYARYQRMIGKKVLQVIGWDSFGLPAENYAIKTNVHPKISTDKAIDNFRSQIKALGISVDWDREVGSHNSDYYKWTQWFFLLMYKRGLAYRKKQVVNWCDSCKTVLANDQVKEGKCERCETVIVQREMEQWYLKITDYAERLLQDLDKVDWPTESVIRQKDWIGKSEGVIFNMKVKGKNINFAVYDSVPQTYTAQTFVVIAPEHSLLPELLKGTKTEKNVLDFVEKVKRKKMKENKFAVEQEIEGIFTGFYMDNPYGTGDLPLWVASYAIADYGSGVVGCSAHDERDFAFAKKYNIPLRPVMFPEDKIEAKKVKNLEYCYHHESEAVLISPKEFKGRKWGEVREDVINFLEKKCLAKRAIQYKLRDWSVSRQRFWGAPIPMLVNSSKQIVQSQKEEEKPDLVLNLHAWGSSPFDQFHPWIDNELKKQNVVSVTPELPETNHPKFGSWLECAKKELSKDNSNTVITARSLGCWTALALAQEQKFRKIILVAPVAPTKEWYDSFNREGWGDAEKEIATSFVGKKEGGLDFEKIKENVEEVVIYLSTNDPYIPLGSTKLYFEKYLSNARIIIVRDSGHFDAEHGYSTFNNLLQEILRPVRTDLRPLSEKDLPVLLPDDVDFKPTGESPLNYSKSFNDGVEEKYGKGWKREPDTLDTFMCSSWYYYRYLDPKNNKEFASPEALKKWMPVDFYLGGPEHVNGHLLYSRFFTKVLYDAGYIDFDEPFLKHRHQGLILGADNRKMSKRWGNVINPTDVINEFGADTCRMYEMFMGPLEDDKPWDMNGVKGIRRFLEKVWGLQEKIAIVETHCNASVPDQNSTILLHKTIKKVTEDIEALKFNTAISKLMILVNEMVKQDKLFLIPYSLFLKLLSPFAPHLAEELWSRLGNKNSISLEKWPEYNPKFLVEDEITLAVQVNGKLRATIIVSSDISEEDAKKQTLENENIQKWLNGKEPKKVIYVKGKLVSIVV